MILIQGLFPAFVFAYASFVVAAAIYLLAVVSGFVKLAVPPPPADDADPDNAVKPPAAGVRPQKRRRLSTRVILAGYIVVMGPFFWLAIFAAGAGHGTRVPMLVYALLALPTSLLALIRWALPPGSDSDIFAIVPLIVAPAVNVGLVRIYCRLQEHR